MIKYIYYNDCDAIDLLVAHELNSFSVDFHLLGLRDICEETIDIGITLDNVISVLEIVSPEKANSPLAQRFHTYCLNFISNNYPLINLDTVSLLINSEIAISILGQIQFDISEGIWTFQDILDIPGKKRKRRKRKKSKEKYFGNTVSCFESTEKKPLQSIPEFNHKVSYLDLKYIPNKQVKITDAIPTRKATPMEVFSNRIIQEKPPEISICSPNSCRISDSLVGNMKESDSIHFNASEIVNEQKDNPSDTEYNTSRELEEKYLNKYIKEDGCNANNIIVTPTETISTQDSKLDQSNGVCLSKKEKRKSDPNYRTRDEKSLETEKTFESTIASKRNISGSMTLSGTRVSIRKSGRIENLAERIFAPKKDGVKKSNSSVSLPTVSTSRLLKFWESSND
eukprot:TRINITY_DN4937_c0_g1_i1.p1 TRINITY_DN4937_c0_g1~~TRINITY_DN4937_c0_g1_i1.p1  ORF type:complete len:397 (+),score=86.91 TRINITY_DN4937_c0_g1_i1:979-2169(+)